MTYLPNNWNAIRAFYREAEADILRAGRNEWGMDAYLWANDGIIHFTPIEEWLWHDIRACDAVLYPQYPVGGVFVDFGNPVAKVAIECDGADFHDARKDATRDAALQRLGWTVYRFPGWLCRTDSDPETGEPGRAHQRMKEICEAHGISRFSRERADESDSAEDWTSMADGVAAVVRSIQRSHSILGASRRAGARS